MHRHDHHCHTHGCSADAVASGDPPSTGFFVLMLSVALILCGLVTTGVFDLGAILQLFSS